MLTFSSSISYGLIENVLSSTLTYVLAYILYQICVRHFLSHSFWNHFKVCFHYHIFQGYGFDLQYWFTYPYQLPQVPFNQFFDDSSFHATEWQRYFRLSVAWRFLNYSILDSKIHGDNMGPTWVLSAPDGPHVGPMNLAIRILVWNDAISYFDRILSKWWLCCGF